MKTVSVITLVLVAVLCGPAFSQEASLLSRLDAEIRSIAEATDASVVDVSTPHPGVAWYKVSEGNKGNEGVPYIRDIPVFAWTASGLRGTPAAGTGVLVGTPPLLVTAAGLVGSPKEVEFRLASGAVGKAKLLGCDTELGLAVYSLPKRLTPVGVEIDSSPMVERGRMALASSPGRKNERRSLALGLVRGSAGRFGRFRVDGLPKEILPGQPAFDVDGRLLGIAVKPAAASPGIHGSAYYAFAKALYIGRDPAADSRAAIEALGGQPAQDRTADSDGSFIPGAVIARVVSDLREHGRVLHAYLGVILGPMTGGPPHNRGAVIRAVLDGSPAAGAGFEPQDRIRSVNGRVIYETGTLEAILLHARPGDAVVLELVGKEEPVSVVLGDRGLASRALRAPKDLGLTCQDLGPELAAYLDLPDGTRGVVVREVRPGSPAAKAGVVRGRVIVGAGGEPVDGLEELRAAAAEAGAELTLRLLVDGAPVDVVVRFPPASARSGTR